MASLFTSTNDGRPPTSDSNDTNPTDFQRGNNGGIDNVLTSSGPVGEPGLPPSRQSARNARRGFGRPSQQPASSNASNTTHVPLTSPNFFRPMSSQRLQVQRGQNVIEEKAKKEESRGHRSRSHRNSNASVHTMREPARIDDDAPPLPLPVSRGGYSVATSAGEGAPMGGSVDSTAPLDGSKPTQQDNQREHVASLPTLNEKPGSIPPPPANLGRNYEYFAGNMLFFLSGRCLNTRAKPLNLLTFILIILPAILFFAFSAPYLWAHSSPAIPIIFAYIFFITLSSFLHAAFSDPGILPRNIHPHPALEEERDPLAAGPPTTEWVMVKTFTTTKQQSNPESNAEQGHQQTTAMEVPTKYCKTCDIWRPPRTHHCRTCDACMETQDHHCVWLNNCVGRRNYRYFFTFVEFGSIMALLLIAFTLIHITKYASNHNISFNQALTGRTQERMAFAMFIYAILALPYPGSLLVYHLFLVGRGETTREYLNGHKFLPADRHRPFSQSSQWTNWAAVLGRPRGPSYLSFKKSYEIGDVRLGHGARKKDRATEQKGRVEDLKKRFTVSNGAANGGLEKDAVKMKRLAPRE